VVPAKFMETVGIFGWNETRMPGWAYAAWVLALLVLLVPALLGGTPRERRTLGVVILGFPVSLVLVSVVVLVPTGFSVQGRHVMPMAMAIPLVAGEILYRNRAGIGEPHVGRLMALSGTAAALIQLVGWYANAHRYAVGAHGPLLFTSADWSPPAGWLPWMFAAAAGAGLLALSAVSGLGKARATRRAA
jgi:hypothetical protein